MWFQGKESNKIYYPGGLALGGIVVPHTCIAYSLLHAHWMFLTFGNSMSLTIYF